MKSTIGKTAAKKKWGKSWEERWAVLHSKIKIKGKTACVALSEEQAAQMSEAIDNHKRLEKTVREMREITQTLILETVPGVRRRKPLSEIPKHVKLAPFYSDPIHLNSATRSTLKK